MTSDTNLIPSFRLVDFTSSHYYINLANNVNNNCVVKTRPWQLS